VRSDEALAAYTAAIELARRLDVHDTAARLRGHAILLCVRYAGAFSGDSWRAQAVELITQGLAEGDLAGATFERGAVLLGRAWGLHRWLERERQNLAAAKRDAARAIAIAEAVDSPELHAAALEGLTWLVSEEGFCQVGRMGARLKRASAGSSDRVEAHESKVTATCCFAWAGRFDLAIDSAREAAADAANLSRHRALHSAMAQAFALVPTGRFVELGERTSEVLDLAHEDASVTRTCMAAVVGIAGHALWLHESLEYDAATNAVDFMNRVRPAPPLSSPRPNRALYESFVAELLRPIVGSGPTRATLEQVPAPPHDTAATILYLRAQLPALALSGEKDPLNAATAAAYTLARSACAPALGWIADWAAAVQTAAYDPARSLQRALAATTALDEFGETYTAARLLIDFLPFVDEGERGELAQQTAQQLALMGALASAATARSLLGHI
jgi:hypothetical protein